MINRRRFTQAIGLASTLSLASWHCAARAQVAGTTRILVGFPAGGVLDGLGRRVADRLKDAYSPAVIVENRPGAGGQIAVTTLRDSPADGSTLLLTPAIAFSVYPFTYKSLPYRTEELAAVSLACTFNLGFAVGPAVPESVRTMSDFMAWAKADQKRATYGSPAAGSTTHLVGEQISRESGVKLTHVGYRGNAPGLHDLLGGQIPAFCTPVGDFLPHEQTGKLRVLAVTGASRDRFFPNVPTFSEQGFPIVVEDWCGFFMTAKTPVDTLQRASTALQAALAHPDVVAGFAQFGMTPVSSTPQAASERVRADAERWGAFIRQTGFTVES